MPNAEKTAAVAEIAEHFSRSSAAVITEYRGLSVKQVTDLRRALGNDTTYAVVKNTLTKRAAAEAGVTVDEELLVGPTAIAFVTGDPVVAAKGLRDFARANPLLVIKGGVLDGKQLSAAEVGRIADLESREVLLGRLAGALKALPTRAAGLFQAPLSQLARLAQALADKLPATESAATPAEPTGASAPSGPQADADGPLEPIAVESPSVEVTAEEAAALPPTDREPATDRETAAEPAE